MTGRPQLDERDLAIIAERFLLLEREVGPRCGDHVDFADGVSRRISHVYSREQWGSEWGVQTSDGGSWYLGEGFVSFSGSLFPTVPGGSLTLTDVERVGSVWIFHHDRWCAFNGVDAVVPFRVYRCSLGAPR